LQFTGKPETCFSSVGHRTRIVSVNSNSNQDQGAQHTSRGSGIPFEVHTRSGGGGGWSANGATRHSCRIAHLDHAEAVVPQVKGASEARQMGLRLVGPIRNCSVATEWHLGSEFRTGSHHFSVDVGRSTRSAVRWLVFAPVPSLHNSASERSGFA